MTAERVACRFVGRIDGDHMRQRQIHLSWSLSDPYAVVVEIVEERGETCQWFVARDSIGRALHGAEPEFDDARFTCRPRGASDLMFCFRSPNGEDNQSIWVATRLVRNFIGRTTVLVPFGYESAMVEPAVEAAIDALLRR